MNFFKKGRNKMETNEKKNDIEALKKELLSNAKNTFAVMSDEQLEAAQV